MLSGRAA